MVVSDNTVYHNINIPLAGAMATSFARFRYYNNKEIKQFCAVTDDIHAEVKALEKEVDQSLLSLPLFESADAIISASDVAEENIADLLNFFGEDTP